MPGHYLFPGFFAGFFALLVPVLLHRLRRRREASIPLPSLFFLAPVVRRSRFQGWRRWLVLLLRCAVLTFLAVAFARPYHAQSHAASAATVVLVDDSFSMQTANRWTSLQSWVERELGPMEKGELLGIVTVTPRPAWRVPLTDDVAGARSVLRNLRPGWGTAPLEPALRMAGDAVAAAPGRDKRILFLVDHQRFAWAGTNFAEKLAPGVRLVFPPPAAAPANQAALSSATVREASAGRIQCAFTLRSFSSSGQTRVLRAFLDDAAAPAVSMTVSLAAHEERRMTVELPYTARPHWVRCTLDPDELPADDFVYALVPPPSQGGVTLYVDAAPAEIRFDFIGAAVESLAGVVPPFRLQPLPRGSWPHGAAVILRNASSLADGGAQLDAFLQGGGSALILVDPAMANLPWWETHALTPIRLNPRQEPWRIQDWAIEHPLVAPLAEHGLRGLLGWEFAAGWSFPASALEPIGWWEDGTVAVGEMHVGSGRLLVCGFSADRRESDWPISSAFVPFFHRAAVLLANASDAPARIPVQRVGEPVSLPLGRGDWRGVAGPAMATPAAEVQSTVTPSAPGVYTWSHGGQTDWFAVNVPPEESNLEPWTEGRPWKELEQTVRPGAAYDSSNFLTASAVEAEQKTGYWWWFAALVLAMVLVEVAVANRTTR